MWLFSNLLDRVAGQTYSQFLEYLMVYFAEHYGRVDLASLQLRKLIECHPAVLISYAEHR